MPAPQPAVELFALDHPLMARTLAARLKQRQGEVLAQLILSDDWPDFKERLGVFRGLQEAIDACLNFEKELERN